MIGYQYRVRTYESQTALFGAIVDDSIYTLPEPILSEADNMEMLLRDQHNDYIESIFTADQLSAWRVTVTAVPDER